MLRQFFHELKRRRVFQTFGIYIVGAWAVLQVADLAFESWGIPGAALQSVWIGAVLLFPLALLFGWRYDITTGGIVRTPVNESASNERLRGGDYGVIGIMGIAALVVAAGVYKSASEMQPDGNGVAAQPLKADAIAVLPFRSRGAGEATGFFSDGVHDDLLTTLANISSLKVISRTSVLQYRDTLKNLRQIGQELGARNILEGGVQQVGDQVRINVQLINAETDEHIWAENYDREMTIENLFAIQSEIAATIAKELRIRLSDRERREINRDRTNSLEAFDAYNRGKQLFVRTTFESLRAAIPEFERALELDPNYLLAHIMLARTVAELYRTGAESQDFMQDNGQDHVDRAIELAPDDDHALAVAAQYQGYRDRSRALDLFSEALAHNPNNVDVLDIYSTFLRHNGLHAEAVPLIERALSIDPLSTSLWHDYGRAKIALGLFEEANIAFTRIAQIDPQNPYASHGAALATILSGQFAEAAYWGEINAKTDVDDFENTSSLATIYASLGDMRAARQAIDVSLERGPAEPYPLAMEAVYLTMNERRDEAVDIARAALVNELEDRWGSEEVFLRTLRDEALETQKYDEAIGWYRKLQPDLFLDEPFVIAPNVQRAADLGGLLLSAGQEEHGRAVLVAAIEDYDDEYVRGAANWPMGIAKADALAQLGRNDEAVAELQRIVDDGWRGLWQWRTRFNPAFDGLRDDPRFEEILRFIENDMTEQVLNFEEPR